jgi:hypothetical protein
VEPPTRRREEITGDKKKSTQWETSQFELLKKCYGDKIKEQEAVEARQGRKENE